MGRHSDEHNMIVKEHLAKANLAVNCLQALSLIVTRVDLGQHLPRIEIKPGKNCNQLRRGAYSKFCNRDGQRFVQKSALVSDCQVEWEEPCDA